MKTVNQHLSKILNLNTNMTQHSANRQKDNKLHKSRKKSASTCCIYHQHNLYPNSYKHRSVATFFKPSLVQKYNVATVPGPSSQQSQTYLEMATVHGWTDHANPPTTIIPAPPDEPITDETGYDEQTETGANT